jgi:hypothetical protein
MAARIGEDTDHLSPPEVGRKGWPGGVWLKGGHSGKRRNGRPRLGMRDTGARAKEQWRDKDEGEPV